MNINIKRNVKCGERFDNNVWYSKETLSKAIAEYRERNRYTGGDVVCSSDSSSLPLEQFIIIDPLWIIGRMINIYDNSIDIIINPTSKPAQKIVNLLINKTDQFRIRIRSIAKDIDPETREIKNMKIICFDIGLVDSFNKGDENQCL